MMRLPARKDRRGFTIIELMVATTVFTIIMTVVAAMLVQYSNSQRKAANESAVQNVARDFADQVGQALQFSRGEFSPITNADGTGGYCVGGTYRFSVAYGRQRTTGTTHGAMVDRAGLNCSAGAQALITGTTFSGTELLSQGMRVARFDITTAGSGLYTLTMRIVYGDDDLLCSPAVSGSCTSDAVMNPVDLARTDIECKSGKDARFCAVSELSTTVRSRL